MNTPQKLFASAVLSFLILFSSCSKSDNQKQDSGSLKPVQGGTMIIGLNSDVDTFNPLFAESVNAQEILHLMLLGLADLNADGDFEPELAESCKHSDDYLKLTYFLRKDALWSDGQPVTAADVKFTFDLLMDDETASPRQGTTEFIKNVKIIDSHTVKFEFTEAYPAQIFDTAGEILPKHILDKAAPKALRGHDFGRNPISSGPFKLTKWANQQFIELAVNEKYFAARPYLDKVIFKIVPDQTSLLMQLEAGEVDMMMGVPPAEISRIKNKGGIDVHQVSGRLYYFIGYNNKNELFADVNVRRALTMAVDRNKIIEALLYGYGSKCLGPLPPIVKWAYNDQTEEIPFDINLAKEVLAKSGWTDTNNNGTIDKDGKEFEFTLIAAAGHQLDSDLTVVIQDYLSKAGVKVNIEMLEWTNFLDHLQGHSFEACLNALSSSYYIDPTPVFHSTAVNLFNAVSYANKDVDKLIEAGRQEMDRQKAAEIWKEFQQKVYYDQPYTFLFWLDKAAGINSSFHNVTPAAISSLYNIEKWWKQKE